VTCTDLTHWIDEINTSVSDLIVVIPDRSTGTDTGTLPIQDGPLWDAHCDAAHALVTLREMIRERGQV
jgi:hypothetical protein